MSAAIMATDATPILDHRYDRLLLSLTYLRVDGPPGSRDVTLQVTRGEGEAWLGPTRMPAIGSLTHGRWVIARKT
jgi:hypothetical protein